MTASARASAQGALTHDDVLIDQGMDRSRGERGQGFHAGWRASGPGAEDANGFKIDLRKGTTFVRWW